MKYKLINFLIATALAFSACAKTKKPVEVNYFPPVKEVTYSTPQVEIVSLPTVERTAPEYQEVVTPQPVYISKNFTSISAMEIANILRSEPNVILLDVRTQQEFYQDGHIHGAKLIPLQQLTFSLNQLDSSKKILVYCRSGNRSRSASQILVDNGFNNVYNMLGGINSWKASGLKVE